MDKAGHGYQYELKELKTIERNQSKKGIIKRQVGLKLGIFFYVS
jgi:hypothetical protein